MLHFLVILMPMQFYVMQLCFVTSIL